MFINPVIRESLQSADGTRGIQFSPIAFLFTRMVANTPYRGRKRIVFFHHVERLFIPASLNQGNIALSTRLSRAGRFTWTRSPLGHKKGVGNSLRIRPINCPSLIETFVEFIWKEDGADLCTVVTTGALAHVHIAWVSSNRCLELSGPSFERNQLRIGNDLDI